MCAVGPKRAFEHPLVPCLLGGRQRRVGAGRGASLERSSAERADCPAVLGLAAASPNSLRSLRSLRSDSGDEHVDERASRWPQALCSSAPQKARRDRPPHAFAAGLLVFGQSDPKTPHTKDPASRQAGPGAGDLWGAEEHSGRGGARSALREHSHRTCLNEEPAGRVVSCAMRPCREHRRAVCAFSARPLHHEPAPGPACRDARQRDRQRQRNPSTAAGKRPASSGRIRTFGFLTFEGKAVPVPAELGGNNSHEHHQTRNGSAAAARLVDSASATLTRPANPSEG